MVKIIENFVTYIFTYLSCDFNKKFFTVVFDKSGKKK